MKKAYIIPSTIITRLVAQEPLLSASANMTGDVTDVRYGGASNGNMSSDAKHSYNVWDDDWSQ